MKASNTSFIFSPFWEHFSLNFSCTSSSIVVVNCFRATGSPPCKYNNIFRYICQYICGNIFIQKEKTIYHSPFCKICILNFHSNILLHYKVRRTKKINSILSGSSTYFSRGFGIRNVNERIKLYFGEQYGVKFYREEGKWTVVEISLPAERSSNL